jgi:hypothetical protein
MQLKLFHLVIFYICCGYSSAQSTIADIDQKVDFIKDKLETLDKVEKIKTDSTDQVFYFKNHKLVMVQVRDSSKIEKIVQWFFDNDKIFYSEMNWLDPDKGLILFSEKTYHKDGYMFAWLNNENTFSDTRSYEFKQLDIGIRKMAEKWLSVSETEE